ncbi:hypothetical protein CQW23_14442 [Capsicum baccatum]|uniref:Uncharacterized protein n=1 Tax=Capsicum baccatum TaxID=33114 RepID=A0A2G2WJ66_CAPBA|nr:hypothetical protein CQW23_14442 [Capsicum baccatum]
MRGEGIYRPQVFQWTVWIDSNPTDDPLKAVELKDLKKSLQPAPITTEKSPSTQVTTSATAERSFSREVPAKLRPLSAPLVTEPRPAVPVVSMVQATQVLLRSVSAAGRFGPDPSPATQSYVPQSYKNEIMGGLVSGKSEGPERTEHSSTGPSSSYGMTNVTPLFFTAFDPARKLVLEKMGFSN